MKRTVAREAAVLAVGVALVVLVSAGCGGSTPRSQESAPQTRSEGSTQRARSAGLGLDRGISVPTVKHCASTSFAPSSALAYAAVVRRVAPVRTGSSSRSRVVARYPRLDVNGFQTVFGVLGARVEDCRPLWFHVLLPSRPNGSTAWVRASDVRVYPVSSRVDVDLTRRRVSVYHWGSLVFTARAAIGASGTPTPIGRFYVNERFLLSSAEGPFGSAALGISAHSDVLKNWVQGGPVALHGTNEPGSIGSAVSHGCVRLSNAEMMRLFRIAPAGTPVLIHL
jgi:hypothetical protein